MPNTITFNPFTSNFDFVGSGGGGSDPNFIDPVATEGNLAVSAPDGALCVVQTTQQIYEFSSSLGKWTNVTQVFIDAAGSSPSSTGTAQTTSTNGNNVVERHIALQPADATHPGIISTSAQSLAGIKTFTSGVYTDTLDTVSPGDTLGIGTSRASIINIGGSGVTVNIIGTTNNENVTNLNVANKLINLNTSGGAGSGSNVGVTVEENSIITGYVETSSDRNSWQLLAPNTVGIVTITPGASGFTLNQGSHNPVTIGTANGLSLSTQILSLALSSTSTTGALSNTDWNTFNNKANQTLNNLTSPTSVNQSLIPAANATYDLGTSPTKWNSLYVNQINNSSGGGINLPAQTLNSSNVTVLKWGTQELRDTTNITSILWSNRLLTDTITATSIDWENRELFDNSGNVMFAWGAGFLDANNHLISNVVSPSVSTDAATKGYVDSATASSITGLTGDVSATGPGNATATIQPHAVTNSKLAQMPANTLKGNNTGSTANASDLTVAQVQAMLSPTGDIALTSFSAANNQSSAADVTGLAFANGVTRAFKALVSVSINATSSLYEAFDLSGIQTASGWSMTSTSLGDSSGVTFSITSAGQVQYQSTSITGFTSDTIKFRAITTPV